MTIVFTDGASRGNPGPGGWGAVIAHGDRVTEIGGREKVSTNNRMELTAVIETLRFLTNQQSTKTLQLFTDSSYVLKGATEWVSGWVKRGWITSQKTPVENQDLWKGFLEVSRSVHVEWKKIPGHSGVPANERADEIATAFADGALPTLYDGSQSSYPVSLEVNTSKKKTSSKRRSGSAYSYLSLVNGKLERHKTWNECERRVKGVAGAKYRRADSEEEEEEIRKEWGV